MDLFDIAVASKLAGDGGGGGGGASNVVAGTFKPTETGTLDIPLSYTGTGYPIRLFIGVKGGFNNPNNAFYSLVSQNAVVMFAIEKMVPTSAPDYDTTSLVDTNKCPFINLRKNSDSSANSYNAQATTGAGGAVIFGKKATLSSVSANIVKFANNTLLQVFVSNAGSHGFRVGIEYEYIIEYSS